MGAQLLELRTGEDGAVEPSSLLCIIATCHFLKTHTAAPARYRVMISIERTASGFARTFLGNWEIVD